MIYHHIMVAVDSSNASNLALLEAIRLAEDQQAKLGFPAYPAQTNSMDPAILTRLRNEPE